MNCILLIYFCVCIYVCVFVCVCSHITWNIYGVRGKLGQPSLGRSDSVHQGWWPAPFIPESHTGLSLLKKI